MQADPITHPTRLERQPLLIGAGIITLAIFLPGILGLISGRFLIGMLALVAPLPILLIANRHLAFYAFLISLAAQYTLPMTGFNLHPYDLTMGILFLAVLTDFLLKGKTELPSTGFDSAWMILMGVTLISAVFAHNPALSIVPIFRIIAVYLCFRLVYYLALEISIRKILIWLVAGTAALSVMNLLLFMYYGGGIRVFGLMGTPFNGFAITALPIGLAFYIWAETKREQFWFGLSVPVILLGIVATQSRLPLILALFFATVLVLVARKRLRNSTNAVAWKRIRNMLVWSGAFGVLFVLLASALFIPMLERLSRMFDSLSSPKGTIALRVVLWTAALKAFATSPLTGIGIGNFRVVDQVVPSIRMEPVFWYIRGITAHSLALQYLSETGVLGLAALLNLAAQGIARARSSYRLSADDRETQISAALLIASLTFGISLFFMGFWAWTQGGYLLAILFALHAAWAKQRTTAARH